jgi:glutamine kinase
MLLMVNSLLQEYLFRDLKRKLILIENTDPSFDWIFGHGISGLIIKFGATNSHIAIQIAEFDLPAAI